MVARSVLLLGLGIDVICSIATSSHDECQSLGADGTCAVDHLKEQVGTNNGDAGFSTLQKAALVKRVNEGSTENILEKELITAMAEVAKPSIKIRHVPKIPGWLWDTPPQPIKTDGKFGCLKNEAIHPDSNQLLTCSPECPFFLEVTPVPDSACTFNCVPAAGCASLNTNKPIADPVLGICRSPVVENCKVPKVDIPVSANVTEGEADKCEKCHPGYALGADGHCSFKLMWIIWTFVALLLCVIVPIFGWILDMVCRPTTNKGGLETGLALLEATKIKKPKTATENAKFWPLSTNLCSQDIAGPGVVAHMNFQAFILVWGVFVAICWACFAIFVDPDLFVLGTRPFGTPRDNCIIVSWGWDTQHKLMWTKILFLKIVYVGTFILCMLHGVRQLRMFQKADSAVKTMKDFTVMMTGMPRLPGTSRAEEEVKKFIENETGAKVVGVSVAWDYQENEGAVMEMVEAETSSLIERYEARNTPEVEDEPAPEMPKFRQKMYDYELSIFGSDEKPEVPISEIKVMLTGIQSATEAFIVFETEKDRDAAVEKIKSKGVKFFGSKVKVETIEAEPATVQWVNFGHSSPAEMSRRLFQGFGWILLGLLFWFTVFYAPYAWAIFTFNYDNGAEPGFVYGLCFSMVVVVGNVTMYEICNRVSLFVGFKFKDDKEACYMVLYLVACTLNIACDFVTTYFTTWKVATSLGFRTWYGAELATVSMFPQGFETYAMQRSLAVNTYLYAFPATYLIPFLIDPFAAIIMPLAIGKMVVRTHKEIQGVNAEGWVACVDLELGRYADLLLNMILAVMIFFFPGGYTTRLFSMMVLCHIYIYLYDHYRLLRCLPTCTFASFSSDWWSQAMFAPLCATILACMIFKMNGQEEHFDLSNSDLGKAMMGAATLHIILHVIALTYVVPLFGIKDADGNDDTKYKDFAESVPTTFFSTNPVHCLRSKHIYKHQPPCGYWVRGKEHLMEQNEKIGCYFDGDSVDKLDSEGAPIKLKAKPQKPVASVAARVSSAMGAVAHGRQP